MITYLRLLLCCSALFLMNNAIANNFAGNWAGTVIQQNPEQEFKMSLIIRPSASGQVVGTWSLGNGCGGTLELLEQQLNNLSARLYVDVDRNRGGRCLTDGRIQMELLDMENLTFRLAYIDHPEVIVAGTLMRIGDANNSTPPLATDYTAQTLNLNRFGRDAGSAQVFGVKMCATALDTMGNCTIDVTTFERETVMVNVSFNVVGQQMDEQIVAKWYFKKDREVYKYLDGKNIDLTVANSDSKGNFFFTIGRDYPVGDYLLEIITDSGDIAKKEFRVIK